MAALLRTGLFATVTVAQSVMLFNGVQSSQFFAGLSTSCDSALNTTLSCSNNLQLLASGIQFVPWNTSMMQGLCTSACQQSLATLHTNVQTGCGSDSYPFNGGNMTWVQQVEYTQYKYGLVCMQDATTSDFCLDVESTWNITTMISAGKATWPQNTTKCYPNLFEDEPFYYVNINGSCIPDPSFTTAQYINASSAPLSNSPSALDYYYERTEMIADDNYGLAYALEYDEYPLEIQCSSCFVNKFIYGVSNVWGDIFDDITAQIWANMQTNCKLTQTITPANNVSVFTMYQEWLDANNDTGLTPADEYQWTANMSACLQQITPVPGTNCQQASLANGIPSASLANLNPWVYCGALDNTTLCSPNTCPLAVFNGSIAIGAQPFAATYTNFTLTQFLAWNPHIDSSAIAPGDAVCVGPAGGAYVPTGVASQAAPSVYTSTATPAYPTPSGSIPNCGEWYEVQSGDYCDSIALNFSLTFSQLVNMNPSLDANCTNLFLGYDYCVASVNGTTVKTIAPAPNPASSATTTTLTSSTAKVSSGSSTSKLSSASTPKVSTTTTSSKTTTTKPSTTTSSVTTPTPTQSGMATGCTKFYDAVSGDTCAAIAQTYGITTAQFESWNPAVGSSCATLFVGYYYCVAKS